MPPHTTGRDRTAPESPRRDADLRVRTGVDVQAISRFREFDPTVAAGIKERAFTDDERAYCERTQDPPQHYAVRWAAKEAFFKLLSTGDPVPFDAIGVVRGSPRPRLDLDAPAREALADTFGDDRSTPDLDVSLSHDRDADVAIAQVVALGEVSAR